MSREGYLPGIELSPRIIEEKIKGVKELLPTKPDKVTNRPPVLCAVRTPRCFYELKA